MGCRICSAKGALAGGAGAVGPFLQLRHGAGVRFALQRGEDRQTGVASFMAVTAASLTKPLSTNSVLANS